jgi:hypothetical protein
MATRRGKTAALVVGALGLATIGLASPLLYDAYLEWRYGIPVVRTWGDLLSQEASAPRQQQSAPAPRVRRLRRRAVHASGALRTAAARLPPLESSWRGSR